jgi:predicted dienelactone hydrolase
MMRSLLASLLCLLDFATAASATVPPTTTEAPFHVGETMRAFHPAHDRHWRGAATQALVTRIWYPVDDQAPEQPHDIGAPGRPIFQGHPVAPDGALAATRITYPLLLLSHGTGGSADSLDWLGARLAADGYIVVGTNHPGNNALEPTTVDGFRLWWERAIDLSDVLDGVLTDPLFGPKIDKSRIGAVGFSLGGYTVLAVAGARIDPQAFEKFCASPDADPTCHPPEFNAVPGAGVRTGEVSPETAKSLARSTESFADGRVRAVFAIAPALGEAFDDRSFRDVRVPVSLLAGREDAVVPVATNIDRIKGLMPQAHRSILPGAGHYTFLDTCVPDMMDRLPLYCQDLEGVDRQSVHDETYAKVRNFFAEVIP